MRALPNMTIINPSDSVVAASAAHRCYRSGKPIYVRIDKGKYPQLHDRDSDFADGMTLLKKGKDILIITTGVMVHEALEIARELGMRSLDVGVLDMHQIKPVDEGLLLWHIEQSRKVMTLEEHSITGGLASIVSETLVRHGKFMPTTSFAIPDETCERYGNRDWMHNYYKLDAQSVRDAALNLVATRRVK